MNSVLDNEHSNLVVINGDLTSCEFVAPENVTALIDKITAPLVDRNMPFAATFGNHDMSKTCNTRTMSEHMRDNIKGKNGKQLSFTRSSVSGPYDHIGTSNYYIPVYASKGGGNPQLSMMLWFFDSKGGRDFQRADANGDDVPVESWVDDKVSSEFRMHPRWRIRGYIYLHQIVIDSYFRSHLGSASRATQFVVKKAE